MAVKQRVAILGGGMASIVAAYELTSTPELCERYDVTVYQLGWRLGGKCASGRNAKHGQRIEEHGLHIWFGFYENAFRVMRDAYEKLGRQPGEPLATWRDAFKPCDEIVLYEQFKERWLGWCFKPPRNPLTPGESGYLPDFWEVAHTMLDYLFERWDHLKANNQHVPEGMAPPRVGLPFGLHLPFGVPFGIDRMAGHAMARIVPWAVPSPERAIIDALRIAEQRMMLGTTDPDEPAHRSLLFDALDEFKRWLWHYIVEPNLDDDDLRLFFTMFDTGTTILAGHHRGRADRARLRPRQPRGPPRVARAGTARARSPSSRALRARALRHGVRLRGRRRRTSPTWRPAPPCTTCCGSSSPTAGPSPGRCRRGWGTPSSPPSTRC